MLIHTKPESGWPVHTSQKARELPKCNLPVVVSSSSLGLVARAFGECMLMVHTSITILEEVLHSLFRNHGKPDSSSHRLDHISEELSGIVYLVNFLDGMRSPDIDSDVDRELPQRRISLGSRVNQVWQFFQILFV